MFVLDYKLDGIAKLKQRDVNAIVRDSLKAMGEYWIDTMLPKHFTKAGAREYRYAPRKGEPGSGKAFKGSYTQRKLKMHKHARPLVWSGQTEQTAKTQSHAKGTATKTSAKCTITIVAPTLNYRSANSKVDMRDEIKRVSPRELQKLSRMLVDTIENKLTAAGQGRVTTTATLSEYGG